MQDIDRIPEDGIDPDLLQEVPFFFARNNRILPLRIEGDRLIAAVADAEGLLAVRDIALRRGLRPAAQRAPAGAVIDAIQRLYGQVGTAEDVMGRIDQEDLRAVATAFEKPRDLLELTEDAPIIRLLNALFLQAVKDKASDIHVEPYERDLEVRMRVDGILHKVLRPPKIVQDALVSRVKIMANLDIAEKRLPQDGRIRLLVGGQDIDIRVSVVPSSFGERAVLRILNRSQGVIGLHEVGFDEEETRRFAELLARTSGIILVTGPTGSGKTTTLYAVLNRIYTDEKNIITVEDPVEYQLQGIGQIQVNPKVGLTFATGLRSILRQDPDIIMIGEIRDRETAEIAIQSSLTGHLVLSTLHTNDAPTAITRLLDMGVEPFLVSSSLVAVVAQRLVRTICHRCRQTFAPTAAEKTYLPEAQGTLHRGAGCARCRLTGYAGRTGIFEILTITPEIRQMVTDRADARTIRKQALQQGMRTLHDDGIRKTLRGETTLEEVLRVTREEEGGDVPL